MLDDINRLEGTWRRIAKIERNTKETRISAELRIEGRGQYEISTGIRFLDHMLELFTKHGGFDLKLRAEGDLDVDQHHTVEDVGIVMGQLFSQALGDRKGINRAGYFVLPMDETLAVVAVDLGGRPALVYKDQVKARLVGDFKAELVRISSAASPTTPARTCTQRSSMGGAAITSWRLSSNVSRAP